MITGMLHLSAGNSGYEKMNQELGSVPARNVVIFELEADTTLSMRPNANEISVGRLQKRKVWVREYFPGTQR